MAEAPESPPGLRKNDWIMFPAHGHHKQVRRGAEKRPGDRVFFRTDHHDGADQDSMIEIRRHPLMSGTHLLTDGYRAKNSALVEKKCMFCGATNQ